jgi:hypothetical protein
MSSYLHQIQTLGLAWVCKPMPMKELVQLSFFEFAYVEICTTTRFSLGSRREDNEAIIHSRSSKFKSIEGVLVKSKDYLCGELQCQPQQSDAGDRIEWGNSN